MRIVICSSLGNDSLMRTLLSLLRELPPDIDIDIVRERAFREETLNFALSRHQGGDLLILGDDVLFTEGWYATLVKYQRDDIILGFPMLYPDTEIIQDHGYDLVDIDGKISLLPSLRGETKKRVAVRDCDAVCGCAMFIGGKVWQALPKFSLEGKNRWGEAIYGFLAKKKGFSLKVLDHFLYHFGKSTKSNKDKAYSSESFLLEKDIWGKIVDKYVPKSFVKRKIERKISTALKELMHSGQKILIYGVGSVADFIAKDKLAILNKSGRIGFCSGLPEEAGVLFHGNNIGYYQGVDFSQYDRVLITVLGKEQEIYRLLKEQVGDSQIDYIFEEKKGDCFYYDLRTIKEG